MRDYNLKTEFIDLKFQQQLIRDKIFNRIETVLNHGQYIMGPEVKEFEHELEVFTGCKHALTCANGTDALSLVLMAWGIGPGDAVFVPSFTYVATSEAPAQLGATPFFVDVLKETFNLDPKSFEQSIHEAIKIGLRPAVVIPVDLFGQPADVDAISAIAKAANIKVLIDGAQSFGASNKDRMVGTMGDATTTSFFPAKPLGCYGDGGAIFTADDELAQLVGSIRLHGRGEEKYDNVRIGLNSRLDTLQAAILIEKLKIFPEEFKLRQKVAKSYYSSLPDHIELPKVQKGIVSSWAQFTVLVEDRSAFKSELDKKGIPSAVYYPKALSKQIGYCKYPIVSTGAQISEMLADHVISLPMHPYIDKGFFAKFSD